MVITKRVVLDVKGNPKEVVIPYDQFVEISEALGLDLSEADEGNLREALDDSRAGERDAFVSLDDA